MRTAIWISTILAIASGASAATVTITPDKQVYRVGETITLDVLGVTDLLEEDNAIFGRLLFDAPLADYLSSQQQPIERSVFPGSTTGEFWFTAPLDGGEGFADSFNQGPPSPNPEFAGSPLIASVTLLATAPGTLDYFWRVSDGPGDDFGLDFFGLTDAPGGSVSIVPEPSTAFLVSLGLVALAARCGPREKRERKQ